MKRLCNLLFELSNEDRLKIVIQLEEKAMNVTNLAKKIKERYPIEHLTDKILNHNYEKAKTYNIEDYAKKIECPTIILHGDEDETRRT